MAIAGLGLPRDGNGDGRGNGQPASDGVAPSQTVGKMTLVEAAQFVERLQGRAAHERELEALRIARDALLVIVSEGFDTLGDRLRSDALPAGSAAGFATASFRAASAPPR